MPRPIAALALMLVWVLLGSGAAGHWHALEHQEEAAGHPPVQPATDCPLHAQLHAPAAPPAPDAPAASAGAVVAFTGAWDYLFCRESPHIFGNNMRGPPVC